MNTVPCKYCDKETLCVDTGMCNLCYEVDKRVNKFAKTTAGRARLVNACELGLVSQRISEIPSADF